MHLPMKLSDYRQKLAPWIIVRQTGPLQWITIGRFRRRGDADGHLEVLRRMIPTAAFEVVFDHEQAEDEP